VAIAKNESALYVSLEAGLIEVTDYTEITPTTRMLTTTVKSGQDIAPLSQHLLVVTDYSSKHNICLLKDQIWHFIGL